MLSSCKTYVTSQVTGRGWLVSIEQVCPNNQQLQAERIQCMNLGRGHWPRFSQELQGWWGTVGTCLVAFPVFLKLASSHSHRYISSHAVLWRAAAVFSGWLRHVAMSISPFNSRVPRSRQTTSFWFSLRKASWRRCSAWAMGAWMVGSSSQGKAVGEGSSKSKGPETHPPYSGSDKRPCS